MDINIQPQKLSGIIPAMPSKSQAHRLLICAAFADDATSLYCPQTNRDIQATADCLRALGAVITRTETGYDVIPTNQIPKTAVFNCCESGSTLRFMLPITGALGVDATFLMEGRLSQRPLSPLWEEMERMGCTLSRPADSTIRCAGKLVPGAYSIDGGVSSQFITGLLFALALMSQPSVLHVTGKIESKPYIDMTLDALKTFCVNISNNDQRYTISPQDFRSPRSVTVEGDWSNAAFWLSANALHSNIVITNLDPSSAQGDRAVTAYLSMLEQNCTIDAAQTPDLVPVLAVVAGARNGATFINAGRLRLKETDRLLTTAALINNLGGHARIEGDCLIVEGTGYTQGRVDATNDHRIAMAAAIAATVCKGPVTIHSAQSVEKSYPHFWEDYRRLGGII